MNTKLYVLLAAGVLALSACKNETATAQDAAAAVSYTHLTLPTSDLV